MQRMSHAARRVPLFLAIACALALPAHAQVTTSATPRQLDHVVVTGLAPSGPLKFDTDPKKPRQPVPASDGADYLKTIPGFGALRNGGTNGDPVLRGMQGSRLNLLSNDGVMHGGCPGRMDNAMSYVAPETYDQLEVTKGPQTVLWGPGASAGTVRFVRNPPAFTESTVEGSASVTAGSFGRRDAVFDASFGTPEVYGRVSGNRSRADDYRDGAGRVVPSAWDKWSADAAFGWTPDADTVIELGAGRGDGQARYAGRGMDGSRFERRSTSLRFERTFEEGVLRGIDARVYRNIANHVMDNYTLRDPNPASMMPMPMASNVARDTTGGRIALAFETTKFEWTLGADAQRSTHRQRGAMGRGAYARQPWLEDAAMRSTGVFGELITHLDGRQRLVAGARVDRGEATDQRMRTGSGMTAKPNPTFGATRRETLSSGFLRYEFSDPASGFSAFAGLGHAERMPDFWELFTSAQGPMGSVNAFSAIAPEKTTQLDAGLQWRGKRTRAWTTVYAGRVHDYILYTYASGMGGMGTLHEQNIGADIRGGELGASFNATPRWTLGGTLSQAWGSNRTQHRWLPQMSPAEARLTADWKGERASFGVLLRGVARQARVAPGQGNVVGRDLGESAGFGTLSLNGGWRLGERMTLAAGIDNLFDRDHAEHLNLAGSADFGYPADPVRIHEPGRNLWAKLSVAF